MHSGSPKARSASSKLTLCLARFVFAFSGSHVQRKPVLRIYDIVSTFLERCQLPLSGQLGADACSLLPIPYFPGCLSGGVASWFW